MCLTGLIFAFFGLRIIGFTFYISGFLCGSAIVMVMK